uniref:DNA2/NAM7 helicase-like C-terminal domain-containing protein n=1 Tax=Salix viminalis TaxID=40686 RepID=A0A6N2MDX4_SALVM
MAQPQISSEKIVHFVLVHEVKLATRTSNAANKLNHHKLKKRWSPLRDYRMHPEICHFPSLHFYDNKLMNGEQMSNKSASFHEIGVLGLYLFYDITDVQELRVHLDHLLLLIWSSILLMAFRAERAADLSSSMNGLSSSSIGFVADIRRMNVALTRAKLSLWILALVKDAKERNLDISAKQPYESLFETAPRDACKRESINNHSRLSRHAENSRGSGKLGNQNEQKVHRDKNSIRSVTRRHSTVAGDGKNLYIQKKSQRGT